MKWQEKIKKHFSKKRSQNLTKLIITQNREIDND
nr:MAG TPA: hypothetical protein [Caudoviricetes sp.]